jgi:hypothetical protein
MRPQQGTCSRIGGSRRTRQSCAFACTWAVPYDAGERPHFGAADSRNALCWMLMRIVGPDIDGSDAIPHIFQGDTNEHTRQEKQTD